jgi:hypothetical protein
LKEIGGGGGEYILVFVTNGANLPTSNEMEMKKKSKFSDSSSSTVFVEVVHGTCLICASRHQPFSSEAQV